MFLRFVVPSGRKTTTSNPGDFLFTKDMITVYQLVTTYCSENSLPFPSNKDLRNCGKTISACYKCFWGLEHPETIEQVRFVVEENTCTRKFIVIAYPNSFKEEMVRLIENYFIDKAARAAEHQEREAEKEAAKIIPEPKKRARKPVHKPAYSTRK